MPRTRSALAFPGAAVLTLALPALAMVLPGSAAPGLPTLDQRMEVAAASESPQPTSDDEKQRVPKTPPGEKGREGDLEKNKDDKDDKADKDDDDNDDDDDDDPGCCVGDAAEYDATSEPGPRRVPWVEGTLATVTPTESGQVALMWSEPGGEEAGAELVADLPEGSDVVVHDSHVLEDGLWLHVSVGDAHGPTGWMRAEDLVARRLPSTLPSQPPLGVVGSFSWFYLGPGDVSDEYDRGGWRAALQGFRHIGHVGRAGMSAGYSWAKGEPKFNYATPTQIDYPHSSLLQIVDLGLSAGLNLPLSTRSDFNLEIGPTLCWVRESAEMDYDSLQGGVVVSSGHRKESLERWRIGGQFNMGLRARLGSKFRVGLLIRAFAISWKSEDRKSLTLDFIGTQPLIGGGIGISLGY